MPLRKLLERELVACDPDTTVAEVAELMEEKNVGSVLVIENDRPIGIVTDRDIVIRCVVKGEDCETCPVSSIMSEAVETASLDCGIFNVIEIMQKNEIRRVPVVDNTGRAVGLISFGDIFHLLGTELQKLTGATAPERSKLHEEAA